jgi:hypothetical protein
MPHLDRSLVALRIYGDHLVPDEISTLLGAQPTKARTKSEKIIGAKGNPVRVAKTGSWHLDAEARIPEDMDGQIQEILAKLPSDLSVWQGLTRRFAVDLFCGVFMATGGDGLTLSAASLAALGSRGIEMGVCIYERSDEERAKCCCGTLEGTRGNPDNPVGWDMNTNRYYILGPTGQRTNISYCPICGGTDPFPPSPKLKEPASRHAFSATLRIWGDIPDPQTITERLDLQPTHCHREGERRSELADPWEHDHWSYTAPLPKSEPLGDHITSLWTAVKPHKDYLLELKKTLKVDVFLGYRSNSDNGGVVVPHTCLEMYRELEIPLGLSIIIS